MKFYYVYIIASSRNGTLYTGFTSDIVKRIYAHKAKIVKSFSEKYDVNSLVYYEVHEDVFSAILREKNIKSWKRRWKLDLIEKFNPDWEDLYDEVL